MTLALTSDRSAHTRIWGYRRQLTILADDDRISSAFRADGQDCEAP